MQEFRHRSHLKKWTNCSIFMMVDRGARGDWGDRFVPQSAGDLNPRLIPKAG
ncbi:MAG: hypothetical protein HC942_06480 [Microcoleus sp. SU_5_6]|nr:hypothetical protein [Microcoleus sp. SU_5_6]